MPQTAPVRVLDAMKALAFTGDLSMGQPVDHSCRTAFLARRLAAAQGLDDASCTVAQNVALLRWSGCTANAAEVSALLGDDVASRRALLALQFERLPIGGSLADLATALTPVAQIHCEVSGDIARTLGLGESTEASLRCIFEAFDGSGRPRGLVGASIPPAVSLVQLAGDLEIFERLYGLTRALELIASRAGTQYPPAIAAQAAEHAAQWLREMAEGAALIDASATRDPALHAVAALELIADVIDLKLPWLTGFSRRVADASLACATELGLDGSTRQRVQRAALIHGTGRAAVPNAVWDTPGPLSPAAWEDVRLSGYWTSRAARQIAGLHEEAEIASFAYERLDGSGHFRGAQHQAIGSSCRVLAAASAWCALRSARPWRDALGADAAAETMSREAAQGRFDADVVQALLRSVDAAGVRALRRPSPSGASAALSGRETAVLRGISLGQSNKQIARSLGISPSTVGTHVENVFRKLGCSSRAAATLKASTLGLL